MKPARVTLAGKCTGIKIDVDVAVSTCRVLALAAGAIILVAICGLLRQSKPVAPRLTLQPPAILADGYDTATLLIESGAKPRVTVIGNSHIASVSGGDGLLVRIRAGVMPGRVRLRVTIASVPSAETELIVTPFTRDTAEDGTPDFLRLEDDRDQLAFRRRFTWLAEAQYFEPVATRAPEIKDCAALIRYAYREALSGGDPGRGPSLGSISKYQYPFTPLGASLFRVRQGTFELSDLSDGAFAQFADARTLWRLNTHLVSRVLSAAMPGDLLFFKQESGDERFHSMIYLGESQIQNDGGRYVLYHTGPDGNDSGEMRRPAVEELMAFPRPEWRPLATNPRFLGVFRWNILRKESDTPGE
jgi:uncharacterized protein YfaT (DUF1175 family)